MLLIGYAGGGTRNIFANTEVSSLDEIQGLKIRVQGAPIWSSTFAAIGMAPTVIAYNEVYNAIQNDVISAGENEAAGVEQMKFYEVAPNLAMTQHAITIRPLCFSKATFERLPEGLQAAILRAGKEAGAYGRQIEILGGRRQARRDGATGPPEAHSLRGARRDEGARRSGHGGSTPRTSASPRSTSRSTRSNSLGQTRSGARPQDATPCGRLPERAHLPDVLTVRPEMVDSPAGGRHLWRRLTYWYGELLSWLLAISLGVLVDPGRAADLLALHGAHPVLHLDRGDGALPVRLDDHGRRHDRGAREHAISRSISGRACRRAPRRRSS